MTKRTKKLSLRKETLTKLNEAALARAAGGSHRPECIQIQMVGYGTRPLPSVNNYGQC